MIVRPPVAYLQLVFNQYFFPSPRVSWVGSGIDTLAPWLRFFNKSVVLALSTITSIS